jgi:hypothetical protein
MGLAKRLARKRQKSFNATVKNINKDNERADSNYRMAYVDQWRRDKQLWQIAHNDLMAILLVAAHRIFGFGKDRLTTLCKKTLNQLECLDNRYVTQTDLERIIANEADFALIETVGKKDHNRQLLENVNSRLSLCFLVSLLDGWNFKGRRMKKVYEEAQRIGIGLKNYDYGMDEVYRELDKTGFKGVA